MDLSDHLQTSQQKYDDKSAMNPGKQTGSRFFSTGSIFRTFILETHTGCEFFLNCSMVMY